MAKMEISIDAKVLYEMYQYAAYANLHLRSEIAGWGHYHKDKGIYKLAPLPKQIVSGAEVDTFPNEIINNHTYNIKDMIVQWHSHVNMSTFFSSVDVKNIKDALELFPVLISIVVNCKHQYSARIDFAKGSNDIELPETITLDVDLIPFYNDPVVYKEVKVKLSKPKPVPVIVNTRHTYYQPEKYNKGSFAKRWDSVKQEWVEIKPSTEEISADKALEKRIREFDLFENDNYIEPSSNNSDFSAPDISFTNERYLKMFNKFVYLAKQYDELQFTTSGQLHALIHTTTQKMISFDRYGMAFNDLEGDEELMDDFLKAIGLEKEIEKKEIPTNGKKDSNKK